MVKPFSFVLAGLAWPCCFHRTASAEELCSIAPASYSGAKTTYPHLATAIETIEQYSITAWYTDRLTSTEQSAMLASLTSECSEDSRMTIAVYGIPNKDCSAGLSSSGSVKTTSDYQAFLSGLATAVGDRKVLYIVEPDAAGLLAEEGGCGKAAGYLENLKIAIAALSTNANAQLYLDVGYWLLADSKKAAEVATVVKELSASGAVKGVTINTSNYRPTDECTTYCSNFQSAMGSTDMSCIIDTSRNHNKLTTTDWCNVKSAGIGKPPTSETGIANIDYFMWVKPPGESDGVCTDTASTSESLSGVTAGAFYLDAFQALWDQGYFVIEEGMAAVADGDSNSSSPTNNQQSIGNKTDVQTSNQTESGEGSVDQSYSVGQEYESPVQADVGTVAPVDSIASKGTASFPSATETIPVASLSDTASTPVVSLPNTVPTPITKPAANMTAPVVNSTATTATSIDSATLPTSTTDPAPVRAACQTKKHLSKL
uniref:Glycoside hydrolase n=1 Tax=Hyaloperonospora arabidopsidis (strain Emoy2) TaxID=559515 RepID=M4C2S9_HYAAE